MQACNGRYSDTEISATEMRRGRLLKGFQRHTPLPFRSMAKDQDPREVQFLEDLAWRLDEAVEAVCTTHRIQRSDIAEAIGVSQQRLSNWTGNHNRPDWFGVAKFCKRFGVSADWILLGEVAGLRQSLAESLAKALAERTAASQAKAPRQAETP